MVAAIDISLRPLFPSNEVFEQAKAYEAEWFAEGTCFEDNTWIVSDTNGKTSTIHFDVPIAPNQLLPSSPELLLTVKLSTYLARTCTDKRCGNVTSGTSQNKHAQTLLNFIRWLSYIGINKVRSLNDSVFGEYLKLSSVPIHVKLNLKERLVQYLKDCSSTDQIKTIQYLHNSNTILNVGSISSALGVSSRILSSKVTGLSGILDDFRKQHGFYIKSHRSVVNEALDSLSADAIRKSLQSVSKLFSQTISFRSLFPEQHRVTKQFFEANRINIVKYSKQHGRRSERTRNIPKDVFFKIMDCAIRWVTDYSSPLIELRHQATAKYTEFSESKRGGSENNVKHYAMKKTGDWLEQQLSDLEGAPGSPYPIVSLDRSQESGSRKATIPDETIEEIIRLRESGLSYKEITASTGVPKGSLTRLINQGRRKEGISLNKALNEYLVTACLLVIYCFTARRENEVLSLQAGCVKDTPKGPVIEMYTAKTYQDKQEYPTTKLVQKAVSILEILSDETRTPEDQSLLSSTSLHGRSQQYWASGKMNDFASFVGLERENDEPWAFSEHQFRRFFAMMYFYRYEKSDLMTLSWHLRHTDFEMTLKYITDADGNLAFKEVQHERILEWVRSQEEPKSVIEKELSELIDGIEPITESRAKKQDKFDDLGFIIHFVPDGACFGETAKLTERSICLTKGAVQTSSAERGTCEGCPNLLHCQSDISLEATDLILNPSNSAILHAARGLS